MTNDDLPALIETAISASHDRVAFTCGEPALDNYLRKYARQNHDRGSARTYVLCPAVQPTEVIGYYSLTPGSIEYAVTPGSKRAGLARHDVPVIRLVRLAVALSTQGQGIGGQLMLRAAERAYRAGREIGGIGLVIDAKNDRVAEWYRSFGAESLTDMPLTLILPFSTIATLLRDHDTSAED